jgi:hypothetical protein
MPRIASAQVTSPNSTWETRADAAIRHNADEFARGAALGRRVNDEMHRNLAEFSSIPDPSSLPPATGALDGLTGKSRPPGSETLPAEMASRVPLPPPMPPKGFNHPRPAALYAPNANPKLHLIANSGPLGEDPRAAHLGKQDPLTGVFVGTGKWDGADAQPTAWPRRTAPLQEHEHQQAAYQVAVRATGDPIEDPLELAHLRAATQTMHDTRTDLRFGRGNIRIDVQASMGMSSARTAAAYDMLGYGVNESGHAGVALAMGAGNCDHNGIINTRRYAPMLGEGETVDTVGNANVHHTWSQINQQPKVNADGRVEPRPTIVMDSWADGPAVRLGDSAWAAGVASTLPRERFDKAQGTEQLHVMNLARHDTVMPGGPLNVMAVPLLQGYVENPPQFSMFAPTAIVNSALAHDAKEKLMEKSSFAGEVMAVAAARQGYNLNVGEATRLETSNNTMQAVVDLNHPSRPPIEVATAPAR